MALGKEPSNILMRPRWWSDDAPRWLNRLAHYSMVWLVVGVLYAVVRGSAAGRSLEDRIAVPAIVGSATYALGFIVWRIQQWKRRSRAPRPNDA